MALEEAQGVTHWLLRNRGVLIRGASWGVSVPSREELRAVRREIDDARRVCFASAFSSCAMPDRFERMAASLRVEVPERLVTSFDATAALEWVP